LPAPGASRSPSRPWRRLTSAAVVAAALLTTPLLLAESRTDLNTDAGLVGLAVTNLGYVGNFLGNPNQPSCEYPLNSNVEHLFLAGLWVGAIGPDDSVRVSTGAQDASNLLDGEEIREFDFPDSLYPGEGYVRIWSNSQNSDNYDPRALATQHIEVIFEDYANVESGSHTPLGLRVYLRVLAWGSPYADDFVILDYAIVNVSGSELRDVYVGFWNDLTVGNTEQTNPYDPNAPVGWNFWDDYDGALGAVDWVDPEYSVPDDPGIWLMYERDDDGEEGLATSWVGTRLLGTVPEVAPQLDTAPVSYHAWRFRNVPARDDAYEEDGELRPGKYQLMSDGGFTRGTIDGIDYDAASNWVQMMATGPFPTLAPGDTIRATFAMVCAPDSLGLLANSKVAQVAYDDGFTIPAGPPSPQLQVSYEWNSIKLQWAPGDSLDAETGEPLPADDPRRSPEQHISTITGKPDFQGYRVYRYQGLTIDQDPYVLSTLVAQYDIVDGIGFDTGLPPLNADGQREFVDSELLDGFPYWYSVVSFSAPDLEEGLPEFQSGFYENGRLGPFYPGPAAPSSAAAGRVNVAPNPYRAGSYFDNPGAGAELGRQIWFTNLPPRCTVKVFTVAGDLVRTLEHDDPADGKLAWDVLSEYGRAIASGLYVYVVENLDSGEVQRGKLVIIK